MKLLNLLFPPKCIFCGRIIKGEDQCFCGDCLSAAPFVKEQRLKAGVSFVSGNTSVFFYEGRVRQALKRLKYQNKPQFAAFFGALLAKELKRTDDEPFDVATWVPAYRWKTIRRGYNQAELLAVKTAKALGIPARRLLFRCRPTRPQNGLTPSQRKANVLGAFRCADVCDFSGKRVLLIDDILTTGATASECARMLLESGCREVYLATVAKTRGK